MTHVHSTPLITYAQLLSDHFQSHTIVDLPLTAAFYYTYLLTYILSRNVTVTKNITIVMFLVTVTLRDKM